MKYYTGDTPGKGEYKCTNCGTVVTLNEDSEALPECPNCDHKEFEKIK